jgi:hypothetical protein
MTDEKQTRKVNRLNSAVAALDTGVPLWFLFVQSALKFGWKG